MKVTLVFPGQGTQYVGMGKHFVNDPHFEEANAALKYDLKKIMLEGPEDKLKLTENTQPAIVAHSIMLFKKLETVLHEKQIIIEQVLGHSVGEYSALCAAGVLSFKDAIRAVHYRGKFMQEATPTGVGSMYAILKQPEEIIREATRTASTSTEKVSPANFNEPNQVVISGHKSACLRAIEMMEKLSGSKVKAIELQVSAPFHCELMKPAELKLKTILDELTFHTLKCPYIANVDAEYYATETTPQFIKNNLLKQVCGSVLWTQSIQKLKDTDIVIEVGPGKVLAGLIKKINPNIRVISLDSESGLKELEELHDSGLH